MKMDVGTIEAVIREIGGRAREITEALVPIGQGTAHDLTVLSIIMLGISIAAGSSYFAPIVRMCGVSAATFWVIGHWGEIVEKQLDACRAVIGLMIPGYAGPTTMFRLAIETAGRVELEIGAMTWAQGMAAAGSGAVKVAAATFILIGMSVPGLLAVLSEITLLLGAAVAPLVLPALAFSVTAPLGWGAIRFLFASSIRVVALGTLAAILSRVVTQMVVLDGAGEALDSEAIGTLMLISMFCLAAGLESGKVAVQLTGGALGGMSLGSTVALARRAASAVGSGGTAAAAGGTGATVTGSVGGMGGRIAAGRGGSGGPPGVPC